MQLTDDMVRVAAEALAKRHFGRHAEFANTSARYQTQFLYDARAALTAALAAMWRPMVEAPVDDTQILAARDDGRVMIFSGKILFRIGLENQPTHLQFPAIAWMPLPSPPSKEGE